MTKPLILIVDDEAQILRFLGHALTAVGYDTCTASTGAEALAQVAAARSDLPVIVLSARDQEMEKIMALDLGANDFIAKPFGIGELLARLRAVLRQRAQPTGILRQGGLVIDLPGHSVQLNGQPIHLTPTEFDLLVMLAQNPGRVLTHRQILLQVWGPAHGQDVPYLRVFIGQLRQKIESDPATPAYIQTEPGVGYRWIAPEA